MLTATWNVAAINNNPFEYWVTYSDPEYNAFMLEVENFLENEDEDVLVSYVFTDSMFAELKKEMGGQNLSDLDKLTKWWLEDYSQRKVIRGFLRDKAIGEKRLTSMPDRVTNTINLIDGKKLKRPTVINAYNEYPLTSVVVWWREWRKFMFSTNIQILTRDLPDSKLQSVFSLIRPINRNKYPAISPEEQSISVQLQLLCLAILDAIFIHIVNRVAPIAWERIRQTLSSALIHHKDERLCQILAESYQDRQVIFLQEVSLALVRRAREHPELSERYAVLLPAALDASRDQNSVILVDRRHFDAAGASEVTQAVLDQMGGNFLEPGDLFAASVGDGAGRRWLLVSFHGDSTGLSTTPMVRGLDRACRGALRGHVLLAGLDANTLSYGGHEQRQGVAAFRRLLAAQQMVSVWDACDDPFVKTTCGARTSLQTQLNKAVGLHQRFSAASVSLKDWILCYAAQVDAIADPRRDNTGARRYVEGVALPTTAFPSDHAVVSAAVRLRQRIAPLSDPAPAPDAPDGAVPPLLRGVSGGDATTGTLFDYWGMGELPPALSQLVDDCCPTTPPSAHRAGSGRGGAPPPAPPQLPDWVGVDAGGGGGGGRGRRGSIGGLGLERPLEAGWVGGDRSVWILFSPRPLSAALCKGWFRAMLLGLAAVSLLRGCGIIREILQRDEAALAGRFFRFTPLNPLHVFVGPFPHGDDAICRTTSGSQAQPALHSPLGEWNDSGRVDVVGRCSARNQSTCAEGSCGDGVILAAEKARLLLHGQELEVGLERVSVSGQSLVVSMTERVVADGLLCDALRFPPLTPVTLKVDVSDDGVFWRSVPLPQWARLHAAPLPPIRASEFALEGHLATDCAVRLVWALGLSWEWVVEEICRTKTWLMVAAACMFGMAGHGRLGTLAIALNCALNAGTFLVIAVSHGISSKGPMIPLGALPSATMLWRRLVVNIAVSAILVWEGPFTVDAVALSFGFILVVAAKADWVSGVICAASWLVALSLQVARWYVKTWVERTLVLKDSEKYNAR